MIDLGKVKPGSTIRIPFGSYAASTGASAATSSFVAGDIQVYKDGSTTQRASASGITATTDFDSLTGINLITIDLSDNTTADFYASGSEYIVVVADVTIDSQTVRFPRARFSIGMDGAALDTTIATLSSQTSFTLTAGPADNNALVGCDVYVHDAASSVQCCMGVVSAYTGSTKTVTLAVDPAVFTMAAKDNISIYPRRNAYSAGGTPWGSGAITAASIASDAITDAKVASDVTIASVTGAVGSVTGAVGSVTGNVGGNVTGSVGSISAGGITEASYATTAGSFTPLGIVDQGTAQSATSTTLVLRSAAAFADSELVGSVVLITGGSAGVGQARAITANVGSTDTITVDAWTTTPSGTITYKVFASPAATAGSAAALAAAVWDLATSGHTTSGTFGAAMAAAGAAGDPWSASLPGSYGSGTAGYIIGNRIDAAITSRMATYTQPTGFLAATFPTTVASTTNITGGTITTVTNLTNAPTSGDFTATMKTSIGTAVAASAVASVTGNVGGNVTGNVGSVTGLTTATIAAATWDLATTGHTTSGTFGAAMSAAGSAGDPWSTAVPGSYASGTAGYILGTNLNATVSSRLPTSSYTVAPTAIENADALLNRDMSSGTDSGSPTVRTVRQALRFLRNKWSISGTTLTVCKEDDSTSSWTSTVSTTSGANPVTGNDPA